MKKKYFPLGVFLLALTFLALVYKANQPDSLESITYFPINPTVIYKTQATSLKLNQPDSVLWKSQSVLDRKAYLRQDAGLLFANGRLIGKTSDWKQNTAALLQEKQVKLEQNALLQAVVFHHAEIHENGRISSAQGESSDQLYILKTKERPISFRSPETQEQQDWKQKLDEKTQRSLRYSWKKGISHFSIHLNNYQSYPLLEFTRTAIHGLPGFTKAQSEEIAGQLWEGLYKNYLLGIKSKDGSIVDPANSTLPLILLANDKTHLLILTETASGEPILLRQMIEAAH